jgi:hypothetical protein
MPHTNKTSAPIVVDIPELEGRHVDLDGYTVCFETYRADADPSELFRGLPDAANDRPGVSPGDRHRPSSAARGF